MKRFYVNRIALLGSTGTIGVQTLDVCRRLGLKVAALSAHKNSRLLEEQVREFRPSMVAVTDPEGYRDAKIRLADTGVQLLYGNEGLCAIGSRPPEGEEREEGEILLNAVVGMVGLEPTLAAIRAGKDIALANKETLVAGGQLVTRAVRESGVRLLPVDSEHSAIFQCIQGCHAPGEIQRLILTASGGPFFGRTRRELEQVTVEQALNHPNWKMGAKITIDSATMMNKGLECIEAAYLFDKAPEDIDIVIHRESVVHSLIEYRDGSVIGQLGVPDMRIPIQYALTYPARVPSAVKRLSLADWGKLTFYPPDHETFPLMEVCKEALRRGGLYPCAVNGANEAAVALFLRGKISFLEISELVASVLGLSFSSDVGCLEEILETDRYARTYIMEKAGR